jgi:ubiquinone biosynthesis protein
MAESILRTLYVSTKNLRTVVKDAGRAKHIATILAKYGWNRFFEKRRSRKDREQDASEMATRLVATFEELGPTFVKFGQILSTRPDLVPPHIALELGTLQDKVSQMPMADVRQAILTGLSGTPEELFASFDEEPIASASIAQVHGARTKDGQDVVVKVQRLGLKPTIVSDISLLRFFLQRILDIYPEAKLFDLGGMIDEFEQSLMRELDFQIEAQSLIRFRENFEGKERIHIPAVFDDLCAANIITMERIRGHKLTELPDDTEPSDAAELYLDAAYQMLFQDGFFHGDLHPGNVFLEADGRLGIIDFGMVGRLSRPMREKVIDVIYAVLREDLEAVARIWYNLGTPIGRVDYAAFESDVVRVLESYVVGRQMEQINIGGFLRELAQGAVHHGIRLPSDFTMMFKAMVTTEGLAKQVASGVNALESARPYIEKVVRERYSLERLKNNAMTELIQFSDLARELPARLDRMVTQIENGDLRLRVHSDAIESGQDKKARATNRLSVAVISGAASMTGALTLDAGPEMIIGLPLIPAIAFLISAIGLMWIGLGIFRQ